MLGGDGQHSPGNYQHNVKRSQTSGTSFMGDETSNTGPSGPSGPSNFPGSFTGPGFSESQQTRLNSGSPGGQTNLDSFTGPGFSESLGSGQIGPGFHGPRPFGGPKGM